MVLLAAYGGSDEGRVALFGPSGLLGWTQSPGLALAQVVTSLLGGEWASHLKRGRGRSCGESWYLLLVLMICGGLLDVVEIRRVFCCFFFFVAEAREWVWLLMQTARVGLSWRVGGRGDWVCACVRVCWPTTPRGDFAPPPCAPTRAAGGRYSTQNVLFACMMGETTIRGRSSLSPSGHREVPPVKSATKFSDSSTSSFYACPINGP